MCVDNDDQNPARIARAPSWTPILGLTDSDLSKRKEQDLPSKSKPAKQRREEHLILYDALAGSFADTLQVEEPTNGSQQSVLQVLTSYVTNMIQYQQNRGEVTADATMENMVFV
jgi:outer membrane protein TolC